MDVNQKDASGSSDENVSDKTTENQDDKVAYSTYKKVLGEKKRKDAELDELRAEISNRDLEKQQAKFDRVLLDTYTTERDLDAALKARLDAVESQLQLSESIIADAKRKLDITDKQVTRIKAGGKEVPKNIIDKMKGEEKQLKTYQEVAASHEKRKQEINVQFKSYIERFRELKANQKRIKEEREARRKEAMGL